MTEPRCQPWTDEEIGWLIDNPQLTARQAGEALGRGMQSVQHRRRELRLGISRDAPFWTDSEMDFLRATAHMTAHAIAEQLGRSYSAVAKARQTLTRAEGLTFGELGERKDPWHVGKRPLLAKTCPRCGLLLEASWFGFNKNKWRSVCIRCKPRYLKLKPKDDTSAKRAYEKVQALTREHAHHHGEPWIERDHKVLADPDLTLLSKALQLGRTYAATHHAVSANGYMSKVGKGEAVKGQWVIDNPSARLAS